MSLQLDVALREIYFNVNGGTCRWKNYTKRQRRKAFRMSAEKRQRMVANAEYVHHSQTIQEALQNPMTYVDGLAQQTQMDLVDMNKFSYKNKGNRWILTVLEVLSRYAFAVPVWRKIPKV